MLTIKSGKKGPQIKNGIIEATIKLIKTNLEYLKLFIKILRFKVIISYLILITLIIKCC